MLGARLRRTASAATRRWLGAVAMLVAMGTGSGCATWGVRSAVSLKVERAEGTPRDATVTIDEQFVGLLGVVAARGVRLPEGEHRITVERAGYFPWDQIVVSDRQPIHLQVVMVRIPD